MRYFNTTLLATFVKVAELKSITAASKVLHLSNSTISEQLTKLESFVGKRILLRNHSGTELTAAGHILYLEAQKILYSCTIALEKIQGVDYSGEIRLAITDYFKPNDLAKILKKIQLIYSNLRFHISILNSTEIDKCIKNNHYDIGITMQIGSSMPLENCMMLSKEPLIWVKDPHTHLDKHTTLPFITMTSDCNLKKYVLRELDLHQADYYIAHTATGVAGISSAIEAGLGISCLNQSAVATHLHIISGALCLPKLVDVEFYLHTSPLQVENQLILGIKTFLLEEFKTTSNH
ncbi:LysR family transcriptional regulator [Acinetobacter calcoaceticus]|uniref:LysR family transcriptional regulator n=1 Tax=Acinetobacter calcoaceticus TaxID=471 RepID=A0A4R1XSE9_ACICA|nr:LysR family transcriptional regulator [Acinetobacter calcoaceticus]